MSQEKQMVTRLPQQVMARDSESLWKATEVMEQFEAVVVDGSCVSEGSL